MNVGEQHYMGLIMTTRSGYGTPRAGVCIVICEEVHNALNKILQLRLQELG